MKKVPRDQKLWHVNTYWGWVTSFRVISTVAKSSSNSNPTVRLWKIFKLYDK